MRKIILKNSPYHELENVDVIKQNGKSFVKFSDGTLTRIVLEKDCDIFLSKVGFDHGSILKYSKLKEDDYYLLNEFNDFHISKNVKQIDTTTMFTMNDDVEFVSFWYNRDGSKFLPQFQKNCLKSFIKHGHKLTLFSYNKLVDVPEGVELIDANEIIDFSEFYINVNSDSVANFSDVFRIKLLYKLRDRNVVWTDADNICLSNKLFSKDYWFFSENNRIINGCLKFGSRFRHVIEKLNDLVDNPTKSFEWDNDVLSNWKSHLKNFKTVKEQRINAPWKFFGSELYTNVGKHFGFDKDPIDFRTFANPIHYTELFQTYVFENTGALNRYLKNIPILMMSNDLLRREPWILRNFREDSFMADLMKSFE